MSGSRARCSWGDRELRATSSPISPQENRLHHDETIQMQTSPAGAFVISTRTQRESWPHNSEAGRLKALSRQARAHVDGSKMRTPGRDCPSALRQCALTAFPGSDEKSGGSIWPYGHRCDTALHDRTSCRIEAGGRASLLAGLAADPLSCPRSRRVGSRSTACIPSCKDCRQGIGGRPSCCPEARPGPWTLQALFRRMPQRRTPRRGRDRHRDGLRDTQRS